MKLIAALLLCVAMTSQATNFAGVAAMNESGITTTQTAGITGTDIAVFYIPVPTTPGQTYVITVVPAPGTPTIERYAFISDGTFDIAHASGYVPQFVLTVGTGAGQLAPGTVHQLWVDSTDSSGNFSCNAAECDMTVRIELYQGRKDGGAAAAASSRELKICHGASSRARSDADPELGNLDASHGAVNGAAAELRHHDGRTGRGTQGCGDAARPRRASPPRLARELETLSAMIGIHCRDLHGSGDELCEDCAALLAYATRRLDRCVFGDAKPTCANCTVHCYTAVKREEVRTVMRYAGPR